MPPQTTAPEADFVHTFLDCGAELAVDRLGYRNTVAMCFRMLTGVADDPPELTGITTPLDQGTAHCSDERPT